MPFDSTELDEGVIAFARFRDEPTLRGLSYALRHSEVWPKEFRWKYSDCSKCAIGLTAQLLGSNVGVLNWFERMFREYHNEFNSIFCNLHVSLRMLSSDITPIHVADAIDRFLTKEHDNAIR